MSPTPADVADRCGPTVLLVDDSAAMRALIRSLVQEVVPVIHEYADAESAVDAYLHIRPDWVLMDIELDGMDGIAATRALRRLDANAHVIIVTGHGGESYRRAAIDAGASAFVLKENLLGLPTLLAELQTLQPDKRSG